ncbi:MAG: helix-turn-helix transcriptional regulator [Clostridia bacterium]|nr:helix-turn-helix transcriptional regulator [Clostridia bacterium]
MNLKAMMKERKIKARDLAAAIGVTERQVRGWMYGESEPGIRHLIALADALGCTVDQLIRKGA